MLTTHTPIAAAFDRFSYPLMGLPLIGEERAAKRLSGTRPHPLTKIKTAPANCLYDPEIGIA